MESDTQLFPEDYPPGSLQRDLYEWAKTTHKHIELGNCYESGADFITRLAQQHPEEVVPFLAKHRMGLTIATKYRLGVLDVQK